MPRISKPLLKYSPTMAYCHAPGIYKDRIPSMDLKGENSAERLFILQGAIKYVKAHKTYPSEAPHLFWIILYRDAIDAALHPEILADPENTSGKWILRLMAKHPDFMLGYLTHLRKLVNSKTGRGLTNAIVALRTIKTIQDSYGKLIPIESAPAQELDEAVAKVAKVGVAIAKKARQLLATQDEERLKDFEKTRQYYAKVDAKEYWDRVAAWTRAHPFTQSELADIVQETEYFKEVFARIRPPTTKGNETFKKIPLNK